MRNFVNKFSKGGVGITIVLGLTALTARPAEAATTITASATDLQISLSLLGIPVGLTVGQSSGTAGAAFDTNNSVVSVNQTLGLGGLLNTGQSAQTGLMTTHVESGVAGQPAGYANANVNNLSLGLSTLGLSALGINATTIGSTTTFDGTNFVGTSNISGLGITSQLANYAINGQSLLSSAINNVILSAAGLTITLNEQIAGDSISGGMETKSLTTNAIHVSYNNYLLNGNLLNGDVIVGQSKVSAMAAVPEAATWAMMIVGFGMVGGLLRGNRHKITGPAIL